MTNSNKCLDPLSVAVQAPVQAEFIRMPKARERDPLFGLSRSYLNNLVLPCRENRYRPPVRSIVLRRPGAKTGVRLVDVVSLRQHLLAHVEPAYLSEGAERLAAAAPAAAGSPAV
jgi:hypothetical protein